MAVFAPNAKLRKLIVPKSTKIVKGKVASRTHKPIEEAASQDELIAPLSRAQRLKRVFNIDGAAFGLPSALCVAELCVSSLNLAQICRDTEQGYVGVSVLALQVC